MSQQQGVLAIFRQPNQPAPDPAVALVEQGGYKYLMSNKREYLVNELGKRMSLTLMYELGAWIAPKNIVLYGNFDPQDCLLVFLFYLCFGMGYKKLEQEFGVPHSNLKTHFGKMRAHLKEWAEMVNGRVAGIYDRTHRLQMNTFTDPDFSRATMIIDGSHFRVVASAEETQEERLSSHKFKFRPAVNYLFVCSLDRAIIWISSQFGAAKNDIRCLGECASIMIRDLGLRGDEVILADKGFIGWQNYPSITAGTSLKTPHKRKRKQALPPDQEDFNKRLNSKRVRIEGIFGALSSKFHILNKPFNGKRTRHTDIINICSAFYNFELLSEKGTYVGTTRQQPSYSVQSILN